MNCKISFEKETKSQGVLAPKAAIFSEDDQQFVYLAKAEGGPEKRTVKTGESDEKMIDVIEGLAEGDQILLKKPE